MHFLRLFLEIIFFFFLVLMERVLYKQWKKQSSSLKSRSKSTYWFCGTSSVRQIHYTINYSCLYLAREVYKCALVKTELPQKGWWVLLSLESQFWACMPDWRFMGLWPVAGWPSSGLADLIQSCSSCTGFKTQKFGFVL